MEKEKVIVEVTPEFGLAFVLSLGCGTKGTVVVTAADLESAPEALLVDFFADLLRWRRNSMAAAAGERGVLLVEPRDIAVRGAA